MFQKFQGNITKYYSKWMETSDPLEMWWNKKKKAEIMFPSTIILTLVILTDVRQKMFTRIKCQNWEETSLNVLYLAKVYVNVWLQLHCMPSIPIYFRHHSKLKQFKTQLCLPRHR